jgi:hypothetical protein
VGIARHHGVEVFLGPGDQGSFEASDRVEHLRASRFYVEAKINRDLVVAASAGVDLAAQRSKFLPQAGLDGHVDVLGERSPHRALPRRGRDIFQLELRRDLLKGEVDALLLVRGEHAGPDQRLRVGATADDVLAKEPAVNR